MIDMTLGEELRFIHETLDRIEASQKATEETLKALLEMLQELTKLINAD